MTISRRDLLGLAAGAAGGTVLPANATETVKMAPRIAEREQMLKKIVGWIQDNDQVTGRVPQSGMLAFGGRRVFIMDPYFRKEAEIYLFGDAPEEQWRLEDYGLTPADIIERAGFSLSKVVDTHRRAS